jgi:hypothetical protein
MILTQEKIAFIHIPKTAGTSVTTALGGARDHTTLRHHLPLRLRPTNSFTRFSAAELKLLASILKNKYFSRQTNTYIDKEWRVFTVVRNPWSRCLSWWLDVQRHYPHRAKLKIEEHLSLSDFVKKYYGRSMGLIPQTYWLKDWEGRIGEFDLIAKQESLEDDWVRIQKLLNTSADLPRINAAPRAYNCGDFYTPETVRLVSELYREEIEQFNYEYSPLY